MHEGLPNTLSKSVGLSPPKVIRDLGRPFCVVYAERLRT